MLQSEYPWRWVVGHWWCCSHRFGIVSPVDCFSNRHVSLLIHIGGFGMHLGRRHLAKADFLAARCFNRERVVLMLILSVKSDKGLWHFQDYDLGFQAPISEWRRAICGNSWRVHSVFFLSRHLISFHFIYLKSHTQVKPIDGGPHSLTPTHPHTHTHTHLTTELIITYIKAS